MKVLILVLAAILPSAIWAKCAPQKNSEVIVMFDMNMSHTEVLGAEEAACKRGQQLLVYPAGTEKHKELGKANNDYNYFTTLTKSNCPGARCDEYTKKKNESLKKLSEITLTAKKNMDVQKVFAGLAKQNLKVKSIIVSGHDGGGSFGGYLGGMQKHELIKAFNSAYKDKPELRDELNSVYLWGCYTATLSETNSWKNGLPSVKMVAGFHGSGPSIGKDATRDYLEDLLIKEEKIFSETEESEIKKSLNGLKNLNSTLAGIYLEACNDVEYYLSREKRQTPEGYVFDRTFDKVENLSCDSQKFKDDFKIAEESFLKYFNGELPIPVDTSSGDLRNIYNFARSKQHCIHEKYPHSNLDPDKVGLILFYNGVKENFPAVFSKTINDAQRELDSLPQDLKDALDTDLGFVGWLYQSSKNKVSKAMGGDEKLKTLHKDKNSFWLPTAHKLERASRKEVMENLSKMDAFLSHPAFDIGTMANRVKNLNKLKIQMEKHLHEMDTDCMRFLPWHERTNPPPSTFCQ